MERSFWLDNALPMTKFGPGAASGNSKGSEQEDDLVATNEVTVIANVSAGAGGFGSGSIGPIASFSITPFFYGVNYGETADDPSPFNLVVVDLTDARDIVGTTVQAISLAIKTLTNLSRFALPAAEERRLDALTSTLDRTAQALKLGDIDLDTAKSAVQTSLAVALGELAGAGMGVLMGALGAWATTYTPSPVLKALGTAGFGLLGLILENQFDDAGVAEGVATVLTNGLFAGAKVLATQSTTL